MQRIRYTLVLIALVCAIISTTASTALADGGYYYDAFDSGFTAGQTFNKINDRMVDDQNVKASQVYDSVIKVGGVTKSGAIQQSGGLHRYEGAAQGRVTLTLQECGNGTTKVKGMLFVYGTTARVITDRSHYWGNWDF
ncbi:MAG: hypothetical protein HDQ87_11940 [Clostridia bacterium]|nr:hypothetical protein [Clostridia bacterium]